MPEPEELEPEEPEPKDPPGPKENPPEPEDPPEPEEGDPNGKFGTNGVPLEPDEGELAGDCTAAAGTECQVR
jgi:hypothetical protein